MCEKVTINSDTNAADDNDVNNADDNDVNNDADADAEYQCC